MRTVRSDVGFKILAGWLERQITAAPRKEAGRRYSYKMKHVSVPISPVLAHASQELSTLHSA